MHRTLTDQLEGRAAEMPDATGILFRNGSTWDDFTWLSYDRLVEGTARALLDVGIRRGEQVLVLDVEPRRAVPILLGLWKIGAVPTNLGLPQSLSGIQGFFDFVASIARRWSVRRLVVADDLFELMGGRGAKLVELLESGSLVRYARDEQRVEIRTHDVALIQLSSGTGAMPKGIVVSHRKLLGHLAQITKALPAPPGTRGISWLPLYHDMGLIGGLLYPLYAGFPVATMSPLDFRREPLAWFRGVSELQATITCAPPSALATMVRLAPAALAEDLRLHSLATLMVGAEPIQPGVLDGFADAFEACGFSASAFLLAYGLAEATVAATMSAPGRGATAIRVSRAGLRASRVLEPKAPDDAEWLTGLGKPIGGVEMGIRSERGEPLPEGRVGEVWLRTQTGMDGYYRDEEATCAAHRDGWLLTGDLGFVRDGQLFVVGRRKDIIIKAGQNISPVGIEEAVRQVDGVRQGGVAVVGIDSEKRATQQLVVVAETRLPKQDHRELRHRIVAASRTRGVVPDRVIIAPPGTIAKTTSGKIRRAKVRQDVSAGALS